MTDSAMAVMRVVLPLIPSVANSAFWHTLGQSPTSSKWDLRTEVIISAIRKVMAPAKPSPISRVQNLSTRDPGIKGKTWVAKTTLLASGGSTDDVAKVVCDTVDRMASGPVTCTRPSAGDIEVEWTGCRPDAGAKDPLPEISEEEKYQRLMAEPCRTSNTTILYFHGGAYYLCDPSTHRDVCTRLAKDSRGRVCNVRYRLAPQAAFPSQLIDALVSYLSLLYPPPGSMHTAIPAEHIVFSGDSAGANLALALLQLILSLRRHHNATSPATPIVTFHGKLVPIPLPAGVATNSAWCDISRALPSLNRFAHFDYLPAPNDRMHMRFPTDALWPTSPPRGDLFCDLSLLDHPLASVMLASDWTNSPPIVFISGEEMLADEIRVVAGRAAESGVVVEYRQYEAMPHVFNQMLNHLAATQQSLTQWGDFCRRCVEEPEKVSTRGVFYAARTLDETEVDMQSLSPYSVVETRKMVEAAKERRLRGFEGAAKNMPQPAL